MDFIKTFGATLNILHVADNEEENSVRKDMIANYRNIITTIDNAFHNLYNNDKKSGIHHSLESSPTGILALVHREH